MTGRLLACLAFCVLHVAAYVCPPGWKQFADSCYYIPAPITNLVKSWDQANTICLQMQAHLLTIDSPDELAWLQDQMNAVVLQSKMSGQWWVGLTDRQEANTWVWESTGNVMNNSNATMWAPSNPYINNATACKLSSQQCRQCAQAKVTWNHINKDERVSSFIGLVAQNCDLRTTYICKRSNISESPSKCDYGDGWLHVDELCWKIFRDKQVTWREAERYCERVEEGRLATIHSQEQQDALLTLTADSFTNFWIGLQVNRTGNNITGLWTDGGDLTHEGQVTYWSPPNEPNFSTILRGRGEPGCVYMSNIRRDRDGWKLDDCDEQRSFACQRPEGVCPPGWMTYHGRCYMLSMEQKSWQDSYDYCKAERTNLLEVNNQWEEQFLRWRLLVAGTDDIDAIWLGFRNRNDSNIWWNSQTDVGNFTVHQPDNLNNGSDWCGLIYTDGGNAALTDNCANVYSFICEADAVDSVIDYIPPPVTVSCPEDTFQYRGHCYQFNAAKLNWSEAQQACLLNGADLVAIDDVQEQAFINSHSSQIYWIGLKIATNTDWKWTNGKSVTYQNLIDGFNRMMVPGDNCMNVQGNIGRFKGIWAPLSCTEKLPYICEMSGINTTQAPPTAPDFDPDCGEGWMSASDFFDVDLDYCYQLNPENRVWSEAQADCDSKGATLASIESGEEQNRIQELLDDGDQAIGDSLWLGGTDSNQDLAWRWVDRKPFSFVNIQSPLFTIAPPSCIMMLVHSKRWTYAPCNIKKPYLCKRAKYADEDPVIIPSTTTLPPGQQWACLNGYQVAGSHCYKLYRRMADQITASQACQRDGAALVSMASELDALNIRTSLYVMGGFSDVAAVWTGLEDRNRDGQFLWTDGSEVTFTDWGNRQPAAVSADVGLCVVMTNARAKWEVRPCSDIVAGFVCHSDATSISSTTGSSLPSNICPDGSTEMTNTTCYKFLLTQSNWQVAKTTCESYSMKLLYIDDQGEESYVMRRFSELRPGNFWVNYKNVNGTYKIDLNPVQFDQYMGTWNPLHTGNEFDSCVSVNPGTREWSDQNCTTLLSFGCKSYRTDYKPVPTRLNSTCPTGWGSSDGKCYSAISTWNRPDKKSWLGARDVCSRIAPGGDLASIHGAFSLDTLKSIFTNRNGVQQGSFWIGLNRLDTRKGFRWSDGSMFDFSAWAPDEPNNRYNGEGCVMATFGPYQPRGVMTWTDKYCETAQDFICQIPAGNRFVTLPPPRTTAAPVTRAPGTQGSCETGWLQFKDGCYSFRIGPLSWFEASQDCVSKNSHLVSIHSKAENDFLVSQITYGSNMHWSIGLTKYNLDNWEWADGSPFDFVFWKDGEPSNSGQSEMCGQMYNDNGFWNDANCGRVANGHICEKPVQGATRYPTTVLPPVQGFCRNGFELYGNKCYGVFGLDKPLNWTDALSACRLFGTGYDLVSISNKQEQAYLSLQTALKNASLWIGFSPAGQGWSWEWSNNDRVVSTFWDAGQPQSASRNQRNCGYVENAGKTGWKAGLCSVELAYVCSGPRDRTVTIPPTQTSTVCQQPGYKEFKGQCYKLDSTARTFSQAMSNCKKDRGNLVSVADAMEMYFLHTLVAYSSTNATWIGLKRKEYTVQPVGTAGKYVWVDGMPVRYASWAENQPEHHMGGDYCVLVSTVSGAWTTTLCEDKNLTSVCKVTNAIPPPAQDSEFFCANPSAIGFGDKCYRIVPMRTGQSWADAARECQREEMNLLSIHSAEQNEFVINVIQWQPTLANVWLGLIKKKTGGWTWSDFKPLEFENWDEGEPFANFDCAYLDYNTGVWRSSSCTMRNSVMCQADAVEVIQSTETPTSTTTTLATTTPKVYCDADKNWRIFNNSCYYVSDQKLSWFDAREKCHDMGSELVSLHGKDEVDFLLRNQYLRNYIIAIGFTKIGLGNWGWTDRSLVDFVGWWPGEPNNHDGSERCAYMFTHTRSGAYERGRWNDQHCSTPAGFACKRPATPPKTKIVPITPLKPGHCPADFVEFGNKCFGLFGFDEPLNWTEARDSCRSYGGQADLASIHSAPEQAFVTSQLWSLNESIWIGLSDRIWNNHFWWTNNEELVYTNWMQDEPNIKDSFNCVEMVFHLRSPGKWRDEYCSTRLSYLCSMPKDPTIATAQPDVDSICPPNYQRYQDACYRLGNDKVNWQQAVERCQKDKAQLTSIGSPFEKAFVESMLSFVDSPIWIGLFEKEVESGSLASNRYYWQDNWPVTFTSWDDGRPVRAENGENKCVTMNPENARWNDTFCYMSHGYVCKITAEVPPLLPAEEYTCKDPEEFLFKDKCYRWGGNDKLSWSEAHLLCLKNGSELISIHSYEENMFIIDLLHRLKKTEDIWIGSLRGIQGGFYWQDRTPLQWTYWARGEPSNTQDEDDCVQMMYQYNGQWNDMTCTPELSFLCQSDAEPVLFTSSLQPTESMQITSTLQRAGDVDKRIGGKATDKADKITTVAPIAAGCIVLVAAAILGVVLYRRKRMMSASVASVRFNNALYSEETNAVSIESDGGFANPTFDSRRFVR